MLDRAELRNMLEGVVNNDINNKRVQVKDSDIDEFMREGDINGDGLISFDEFVA